MKKLLTTAIALFLVALMARCASADPSNMTLQNLTVKGQFTCASCSGAQSFNSFGTNINAQNFSLYNANLNGIHSLFGGLGSIGSIASVGYATPNAPSIVSGFAGGANFYYYCEAADQNGPANLSNGLGATVPSTSTGTVSNVGTMQCSGSTNAQFYFLLRAVTPTLTGGSAQNVYIGSCTVPFGSSSCNVADANTAATSIFVENGNGTAYSVANGFIAVPGTNDSFYSNLPSGSAFNHLTLKQNGAAVGAWAANGNIQGQSILAQPSATNVTPLIANGPAASTSNEIVGENNSTPNFVVTKTGSTLPNSIFWNFGTDVTQVFSARMIIPGVDILTSPNSNDIVGTHFFSHNSTIREAYVVNEHPANGGTCTTAPHYELKYSTVLAGGSPTTIVANCTPSSMTSLGATICTLSPSPAAVPASNWIWWDYQTVPSSCVGRVKTGAVYTED